MKNKISIDLGSAFTKIYKSNADIVLYEPTAIAIENNNYKKPIAYGYEALKLLGKTSNNVKVIYPVNSVEIIDEKALKCLLLEYINRVKEPFEFKPDILFSVTLGANRESIKNFEKIFNDIGYYNIEYAELPILSLIGSNASLEDGTTSLIFDLGASQTTICALTLSGVISGVSIEYGLNKLNSLIMANVEEVLGISISESQAENLKIEVGGLEQEDETKTIIVGKDVLTGKPKSCPITCSNIYSACKTYADKIIEVANLIISNLNEDVILDVKKRSIILVGGGSLIYGIKKYLENALPFKVTIPPESELSSAIGAGRVIEDKALLNKIKLIV